MSKNAMRADLSRQMKKNNRSARYARIPHIDKSGTLYCSTVGFAQNKDTLRF
jgi:hypothetical protein